MYTYTSTKENASRIKKTVDRLANANCEITHDSKAYRISENSISGRVFSRVRDLIECGCNPLEITLDDVTE